MGVCVSKEDDFDPTPLVRGDSKGRIILSDFHFEKVVGRGAFGKVMMVRKKDTDEIYAMKILKKSTIEARNQRVHTKTERAVLEKVQSPFIVELFFAFQTSEKLYYVMEFLNGGELFFHLRKEKAFKEPRAVFYAAEIVLALQCLHDNDIIYRDLKPENVLLDYQGHIKLSDFGLSKEGVTQGHKKAYSICGTPDYLAPEIIEGVGHDKAVDWWSLGVLIYEMLIGSAPFYHRDRMQLLNNILHKEVSISVSVSDNAKNLIGGLLCRNPHKRLGSTKRDAEEIKQHPFFASINWTTLAKKEVEPPFQPPVKGKDDYSNFSTRFLNEPPSDTPGMSNSNNRQRLYYEGFTYNKNEINFGKKE